MGNQPPFPNQPNHPANTIVEQNQERAEDRRDTKQDRRDDRRDEKEDRRDDRRDKN